MNYAMFNEHTETYFINGEQYKVTANFTLDFVRITWNAGELKYDLDEYTKFDGNMRDFVESKINS